jgi:hypothetical protein
MIIHLEGLKVIDAWHRRHGARGANLLMRSVQIIVLDILRGIEVQTACSGVWGLGFRV